MTYEHAPILTTNATPTEIANIYVDDGFAGLLKIDVIGIKDDGTGINTGIYAVKFSKDGTLTIGTLQTIFEDNDDAVSIGVVADVDENISIQATGIAANIVWIARTEILSTNFSIGT